MSRGVVVRGTPSSLKVREFANLRVNRRPACAAVRRIGPTSVGSQRALLEVCKLVMEWLEGLGSFPPGTQSAAGFMHLEVSGGAAASGHFQKPAVRPRVGKMRGRGFLGAGAVPFGRRTWGGHPGLLVLGDCYGNTCGSAARRAPPIRSTCMPGSRSRRPCGASCRPRVSRLRVRGMGARVESRLAVQGARRRAALHRRHVHPR
jgi:hypothetical protein